MQLALSPASQWSPSALIAFRFFFVYFTIYIFPFPLNFIPGFHWLYQPLSDITFNYVNEITRSIRGVDYQSLVKPGGSGDTTYNYIQVFLFFTIAILTTIVWSIVDRKRNSYENLLYWLVIILRYYLAVVMIGYGFAKVFKTQFPFPVVQRLMQTYGESSPMGLLWTFMGYSVAYNIFTGLGEVVGGLLLLFKRTTQLGAFIVIAVMSNVVMLNFAYDVPVKLFSSHLLFMAIFIVIPDLNRHLKFWFTNEIIEPVIKRPLYKNRTTQWMYYAAKGIFIIMVLVTHVWGGLQNTRVSAEGDMISQIKNSSFSGEYKVDTFILNSDTIAENELPTRRWSSISIIKDNASIKHTDGGVTDWKFHSSGHHKKVVLLSKDLSTIGNYNFISLDSATIQMSGIHNQDTLTVLLTKTLKNEDDSFLLVSRGFHWINEYPYNR
ncbi:DoxX family protein [Chryseosolibacter indicus]|uniref:DoxX family protein n=1 Tax=Chryseosolibacter indicus TaxID=2782351 RepID=A0ABS5VXL2_9BACT|nr:DoxX family protein [Chryseosolibacter indicus]MBT1706143.1 DoxX family protein [Chryseosolibacter indicus]